MKVSLRNGAIAFAFAVMQVVAPVAAIAAPSYNVPGNNGTLKVHEIGTPAGTENNDPKVCAFNIEGFGFDKGQSGYLKFDVQGKDDPKGISLSTQFNFGAVNENGYAVSQNFNAGNNTATLSDGHYKATLYGKDRVGSLNLNDLKAKSKVFKVECSTEETNPVQDTNSKPEKPVKENSGNNEPKPNKGNDNNSSNVPANNGTLKVHEIGTPAGTENNDPKVCAFNIEGFGFDKGQSGYLVFTVQGKDAPHGTAPATKYLFGPTDNNGYAVSQDFNNGSRTASIPNGHYKVTLYGKDTANNLNLADEKAKSKVFKVTCAAVEVPGGTTPTTTTKPNEGNVLDDAASTTTPNVAAKAEVQGVMHDTGSQILLSLLMSSIIITLAFIVMSRQKSTGLTQEQIQLIAL